MADKVVAKYVADVKDYIKEIEKATGIAQKDFQKVNETAGGLEKGLKKIGGAVAAAFAVDRIVSFTSEASKLAAEGEGVRKAFARIGDPKLLDGLRKATRGTVSDLELMKQAVRAQNFKIPLESLAKLFEFARRRAKETGQSVDYLVNSITMGIGRKSPLILDNLGISAIELRKRFDGITVAQAEIGDVARIVGDIATEEMKKMGDEAITTADRMKQLQTTVDNFTEKYGDMVNKSALFYADLFGLIDLQDGKVKASTKAAMNIAEDLGKQLESGLTKPAELSQKVVESFIEAREIQAEIMKQRAQRQQVGFGGFVPGEDEQDELIDRLNFLKVYVREVNALLDKFENDGEESQQKAIRNVFFYKALIEDLTEEQEAENTSLERNEQIVQELIVAREKLNDLLGKNIDEFKAAQRAQGDLTRMVGVGIGANFFHDTLEQLKAQLKIQQQILETNGANTAEYVNAAEQVDILTEKIEKFGEKTTKTTTVTAGNVKSTTDETLQEYQDYANATVGIASNVANMVMQQAQRANAYEQKLLEQKFDAGLMSQEEFDRKSKEMRRQRAQQERTMAIFEASLAIPEAIMQAYSSVPAVAAPGFAAAAGVVGAAQLAIIASTPLPQFAKGTKNAPEGFKWVGEEGPELIYDRGGYPIITHRESMKILEKYNIESVDIDSIQRGGFESMAASAKLQGFSDSNILVATDRLRESNKRGFVYMADRIADAMKKSSRNGW